MNILEQFREMKPMKYHEADLNLPKAKEMIENKDNQFFAMRKYDGEWCRAIITAEGVILQSRSVSKVTGTYGDKTDVVPHIVEELEKRWPVGTVLLGELAFDDFESTSREAGSVLRCKAPKAIERQKDKKIHFFIFDVLAYNGEVLMNKKFEDRFLPYGAYSESVYFHPVMNSGGPKADFMEFADYVWGHGGEGIMIVRKDMKYEPGKRTAWKSLKVKKKLGELEAQVVGFIEPNRLYEGSEVYNWAYWVNAQDVALPITSIMQMRNIENLTPVTKPYYFGWKNGVIVNYKGNEIRVTSGLTDQVREYLATDEAKTLLADGNMRAKITGMELTEDSIRHPVFLSLIK